MQITKYNKMKKTSYTRISDIPIEELNEMMIAYGKAKSRTVRTSRAYLRSLGMDVSSKGVINIAIDNSNMCNL